MLLFKRLLKYLLYTVVGAISLLGIFILYLQFQPPFYLPKPTGPYTVGTELYHWTDAQRKDRNGNDPAHPYQELMVKIWFPTSPSAPMTAVSYAPDLLSYLKETKYFVWLLSGAARKIYCYETIGEPIAADKPQYPVILFSPGQSGRYDSNTLHCQELASNGYIVVGISHPDDSTVIKFPDGHIRTTPEADPLQGKSFMERRKIHDQEIIEERIANVRFVLDQLEALANNEKSIFYQRLDKDHIGIFGQSLGGSAAVSMTRRDPRIKAGVDMDGSLFGIDATERFDKPFMFMMAGESLKLFDNSKHLQKTFDIHTTEEEQMLKDRYLLGMQKLVDHHADQYLFALTDAGHINFTTNTLLLKNAAPALVRPIIKFALVGPLGYGFIDSMRATEIVNAYLVNFFDKYLKGQPSELLDGDGKRFAEVENRN